MRVLVRYWFLWLFVGSMGMFWFGFQEWYHVRQYEAAAQLYQEALHLDLYAANEFERATIGQAGEIFRREAKQTYARLHFLGRGWVDPDLTILLVNDREPVAPSYGRLYEQMILAGYQQIRARILQESKPDRARRIVSSALGFFSDVPPLAGVGTPTAASELSTTKTPLRLQGHL